MSDSGVPKVFCEKHAFYISDCVTCVAMTQDPIDDFLKTLKIHNKDLDVCFNDAVAVAHLKKLIVEWRDKSLVEMQKQLDLERVLNIKGIEDYQKFKNSGDEFERTAAWINQLSPHNLERGVEHLRWRFELKRKIGEN